MVVGGESRVVFAEVGVEVGCLCWRGGAYGGEYGVVLTGWWGLSVDVGFVVGGGVVGVW